MRRESTRWFGAQGTPLGQKDAVPKVRVIWVRKGKGLRGIKVKRETTKELNMHNNFIFPLPRIVLSPSPYHTPSSAPPHPPVPTLAFPPPSNPPSATAPSPSPTSTLSVVSLLSTAAGLRLFCHLACNCLCLASRRLFASSSSRRGKGRGGALAA